MKQDSPLVLVAGGGTGGHVFPGLALVEEMQRLRPDLRVRWVGTADRVEARAVPAAGIAFEAMDVQFLKGRRGLALAKALAGLPRAGVQALALVRRHRPAFVVGLGGFASGPLCAAAMALGVPVYLLEQNARPGLANRLLAPRARAVFATFPGTAEALPGARVELMGNPVRPALLEASRAEGHAEGHAEGPTAGRGEASAASRGEGIAEGLAGGGGEGAPIRLLVLGGSQGARAINEGMPEVAAVLRDEGIAVRIRHAAGRGLADAVRAAYAAVGVEAQVEDFIDDMASAYASTDLAITRAGATTIAELGAVGLPAFYIPFPHAADDHQRANAQAMVEAGAGVLCDEAEFGAEKARRLLAPLLRHPQVLERMRGQAARTGRPEAGAAIARTILQETGLLPAEGEGA